MKQTTEGGEPHYKSSQGRCLQGGDFWIKTGRLRRNQTCKACPGRAEKIQCVQEIPSGEGSINGPPLIKHYHMTRNLLDEQLESQRNPLKKDQSREMLLQLSQAARQVTALFVAPSPISKTRGWAQAPAFQECWIQRTHLPKGQTLAALSRKDCATGKKWPVILTCHQNHHLELCRQSMECNHLCYH